MQRHEMNGGVSIVVHDVTPATWPECARLLQMLDDVGANPATLLVVPHYHHANPIEEDAGFVRALDARLARGDELALHGYHHCDDAPPPRTLRGYVERRVLTRAEGEFSALDEAAASLRLAQGIAAFRRLGWPLYGFVPPAWLLGKAGWRALDRSNFPFRYVSSRGGVYRLPEWRFTPTANLCYSPDRGWRRAMSRALIRRELARARGISLLRLSLHPQDARYPAVVDHWRSLIVAALALRTPVTKIQWASAMRA
jgi:predicted deacetylase